MADNFFQNFYTICESLKYKKTLFSKFGGCSLARRRSVNFSTDFHTFVCKFSWVDAVRAKQNYRQMNVKRKN